jgi:hypothetical protein
LRLPSADCEGMMICKECATAAAVNAKLLEESEKRDIKDVKLTDHPKNCGCPCMHMRPGSWKGKK